ncbi:MAG: MATE family efflux transporter [Myxococcota bacterium]|nr:MATE family efflux transporter [Myxococcota bacterium]
MATPAAPTSLLTTGRIAPLLRRLAVPMVIGVFALLSVNLVDTYFVGLLGTEELAAMSFTFPIVGLIMNLCMGLGIGVTATISRLVGSEEREQAEQVGGHALLIAGLVSLTLALVGALLHDPIFRLIGAHDQLLIYLWEYMRWWFIGLPFIVILIVLNGVLRAHGNSKTPMRLMLLFAGMNLILDPLLIFGFGELPALRLEGAAIATLIARILAFTFGLRFLFGQGLLSLAVLSPKGLGASWRAIASIGIPAAMTNALTPFAAGLITALIALHGEEMIAGYGLAIRFEGLFLLVPMVMGGALSPFIGQNWGAQLTHRVIEALTLARRLSIVWGLAVWLLVELFAPFIAQGLTDDTGVQSAFIIYLRVCSASYVAQGVIYAANATFNAINRPLRATLISTMNSLIIAIPLAYVGHYSFGYFGIVCGLLIARLVTGVVAYRWVWGIFREDEKRLALSDEAAKSELYQLEQCLPALAVHLEQLVLRLSHLSELQISGTRSGMLTYLLREREVAHLHANGTFDICLPPELRDAVVEEGWGHHHRREHDGCWVSHTLAHPDDLESLVQLICIAHAYQSCLLEPAPLEAAKSETARVCEVTRTLESRADLQPLELSSRVFQALFSAVRSARASELNQEGSAHA